MTQDPKTQDQQKKRHNGFRVLAVVMLLAALIGVMAYWRFIVSDRHLRADLEAMAERGAQLTAEQCVDATLSWAAGCQAMKSLCDASAQLIAHRCLDGRDRSTYCAGLGEAIYDTKFGYKECQARGVTRTTKKTCAAAYRAIAAHCHKLRKGAGDGSTAAGEVGP